MRPPRILPEFLAWADEIDDAGRISDQNHLEAALGSPWLPGRSGYRKIEEFCARAIKNINLLDEIEFQSYEMAILHNKNLLNFIDLAKKDELFKFDKTAYDDEFLRIQKCLENLKIGAKMQLHTEIYKQIFDILTRGFKDKIEQIATLKRLSKELIENV